MTSQYPALSRVPASQDPARQGSWPEAAPWEGRSWSQVLQSQGDRTIGACSVAAALVQGLGQAMTRGRVEFPTVGLVPSSVQALRDRSPAEGHFPALRYQQSGAMRVATACLIRLVEGLEAPDRAGVLPSALALLIALTWGHVGPRSFPGCSDHPKEEDPGWKTDTSESAESKWDRDSQGNDRVFRGSAVQTSTVKGHVSLEGDGVVRDSEMRDSASKPLSLQRQTREFLLGNTFLRLLERLPLGPDDALQTLMGGPAHGRGGTALQAGPADMRVGGLGGLQDDGQRLNRDAAMSQRSCEGFGGVGVRSRSDGGIKGSAGHKYCELAWILLQELADPDATACPVTWDCLRAWAQGLEGDEAREFANVEALHASMLGLPF